MGAEPRRTSDPSRWCDPTSGAVRRDRVAGLNIDIALGLDPCRGSSVAAKAEPAASTIVPAQPPAQAELPTPPLAQPRVSAGDATDKAEFLLPRSNRSKRTPA